MALDFGDVLPLKDFHSHKVGGRNIIFGKYEMGSLLGQGTFSKVYKGKNLMTQESVAIKVLHKEQVEKRGLIDQIKREISVMHLVKHPNIVELKEVMATKAKVFFVMEYVRGGELFAKVKQDRLQEHVARKYFQQLISAVDFCHSRGVSHRDLKPENLLLDENQDLKVSDFGFSALPEQSSNDGLLHTQCGTPAYVAPEILRKKGYVGAKADIWSCGVILFALLAGYLPFLNENLMKMYVKIFKAEYEFPPWISSDARKLISRLLVVDPEKRFTIPQIMKHPWFQKGFTKVVNFGNDHLENGDDHQMSAANCKNGEDGILESKYSPPSYNAFDFISSMSTGFDLSGLFESKQKMGSRFTSKHRAAVLLTKLVSVAKNLNFSVAVNEDEFKVKLQRKVEGRKGRLSMTAEVFEVAPEVTIVEFSQNSGDTLEHSKFWEEDLRPALKDIVWTWQGENLPVNN